MKLAVVGAGLGGLTSARALVAAGHDVHVFDAAPRVGGVLGTTRVDGFVREHAASSFLGGPADGAYAVCEALGVPLEKASPKAKNRWIYLDGKLRALPRSPIDLVRSDLLTWRGKLDLLREPLRPARPEAGDESMYAFASRRLGAEAARAIVAPFVTGVYAADAHEVSLEAGFPRIAALDAAGGLVRGMVKNMARGMAGRLRGHREVKTPRGMYAPVGGLGAMVDVLGASLGDRVHVRRVARVEPTTGGVTVDGERWDGCVLAIPAQDAGAIVATPELSARLAAFHRAAMALVYLGYDAASVPGASDGFGFLAAHGEDIRVLGVVFESVVWPDRAPDGKVLLRCIFGGGRDPDAMAMSDTELIEQARRDVGRVLGATGAPSHTSVIRWERGVAQYRLGHRERVREATTVARSRRIALAGADYRGPGVNDICADAATIVADVAGWR